MNRQLEIYQADLYYAYMAGAEKASEYVLLEEDAKKEITEDFQRFFKELMKSKGWQE